MALIGFAAARRAGMGLLAFSLATAGIAPSTPASAKPAGKPIAQNRIEAAAHITKPRQRSPKRDMLGNTRPDTISFKSNGRSVRVQVFRAQSANGPANGKYPAVMMLHGAGGIGGGMMIYPQAKALAARGISAFVVSYYDGLPEKTRSKDCASLFTQRDKVIEDAFSFIASQADVDPDAIGVFGLSLGGFHGLSLAARDWRVAALVNVFGAVPQTVAPTLTRLPPTLIMHGDKDRIVPVAHSRVLSARLDQLGVTHELVVYQGSGHVFNGQILSDSIRRTTDFFDTQLLGSRGSDALVDAVIQE